LENQQNPTFNWTWARIIYTTRMKKWTCRILLSGSFIISLLCSNAQKYKLVAADNPLLQTQGRIGFPAKGTAEIYWPGSSFSIQFKGSKTLSMIMKDERGHNYFNVIIDGQLTEPVHLTNERKTYPIFSPADTGLHCVQIIKQADWFRGKSIFYGFELEKNAVITSLPAKRKNIEFYGNSITVGAAVEDMVGDSGDSTFTNNYLSYAAITARHFNAGYSCIASSGIGLMASWGSLIMPQIYNKLNPDDSLSSWDFSKFTPNIVVVNLLQNDQSIIQLPNSAQFKKRFGNKAPDTLEIIAAYKSFIANLRAKYPAAHIICALGSMSAVREGSPWPGYIKTAVSQIKDPKIHCHFFAPISGNKHPKINEQQAMAESLIEFIEKHISW
jgi:hypothetical protein